MNFRSPIILIIVVVAIFSVIGWAYYDNWQTKKSQEKATATQTATEQPVSNLTNVDPTDFDSAVKKEFALANEKAAAVNPNYKLSTIEVEIDKDLLPESTNTRYVFSAPDDTLNNWMITISQVSGNYIRALVPKTDYLGSPELINTSLWKYNYVTALQLAEQNGGLDWREKNTLSSLKLTLRHSGTNNWLLWIVEYTGVDSNLTVKLDANSGKVVTE